jgi:hypothetical protein
MNYCKVCHEAKKELAGSICLACYKKTQVTKGWKFTYSKPGAKKVMRISTKGE